jgi:hypothetical protein
MGAGSECMFQATRNRRNCDSFSLDNVGKYLRHHENTNEVNGMNTSGDTTTDLTDFAIRKCLGEFVNDRLPRLHLPELHIFLDYNSLMPVRNGCILALYKAWHGDVIVARFDTT